MAETRSGSFNSIDLDSLTYYMAVKSAEEQISGLAPRGFVDTCT